MPAWSFPQNGKGAAQFHLLSVGLEAGSRLWAQGRVARVAAAQPPCPSVRLSAEPPGWRLPGQTLPSGDPGASEDLAGVCLGRGASHSCSPGGIGPCADGSRLSAQCVLGPGLRVPPAPFASLCLGGQPWGPPCEAGVRPTSEPLPPPASRPQLILTPRPEVSCPAPPESLPAPPLPVSGRLGVARGRLAGTEGRPPREGWPHEDRPR